MGPVARAGPPGSGPPPARHGGRPPSRLLPGLRLCARRAQVRPDAGGAPPPPGHTAHTGGPPLGLPGPSSSAGPPHGPRLLCRSRGRRGPLGARG
eukprot:4878034-Alexandrium_andersonii.AAC.1